MLTSFVIVHRTKPRVFKKAPPEWRVFSTCLRSLAISFSSADVTFASDADEIFRGEQAYQFLIEVVCGLHSPIVGETEVFGQFRRFADEWSEQSVFFQNVYADVKNIRKAYLSHLGSQSYGSWVRKQIEPGTPVHILGTGQLAQEILPWLEKQGSNVTLYSRSPRSARARLGSARHISDLANLSQLEGVVVVAAPVSAGSVDRWLNGNKPKLLIDLRDDSATDLIAGPFRAVHLVSIFSEIEQGRAQAAHKIQSAFAMVLEVIEKRFYSPTNRPFGWDDLCA